MLKNPSLIKFCCGFGIFTLIFTGLFLSAEGKNLNTNTPASTKNTTFIKTYRFYNNNESWDIWPTKEENFILAGWTTVGLQDDAFILKTDSAGAPVWTKLVGSKVHYSGPMGKGPAYDAGYSTIQLKDGSYLLAGQTNGYVGDEEAKITETADDIFFAKFDQNGNHLWTETVGDKASDTPISLYPTDDGGFMLYAVLEELNAGAADVGDTYHYFALAKFDKDGQKQWIKKTNLRMGGGAHALGTMGIKDQLKYTRQEGDSGFVMVGLLNAKDISKTKDEQSSPITTVVKLNKKGHMVWAKSLEAVAWEIPSVTPTENNEYVKGYMKMRFGAGDFSVIQQTPDGGYLVFGYASPIITGMVSFDTPLTAVKLDKNGNLKWAKTIETGLQPAEQEFTITKTPDNDFIIMHDFMSGGEEFLGEKYNTYMKKTEEATKLCKTKKCKLGDEEKDPELKKAYEEMNKAQDEWSATSRKHIALIKVDSDFNVRWVKTIGPEVKPVDIRGSIGSPNEFIGNSIKIANDQGIIIAGVHSTDVVCAIEFGIKIYCNDALFIKLDVNGNLADNPGLVSEHTSVSQRDLSQYIVLKNQKPVIQDYELRIVPNQKSLIATKRPKATTSLSAFKENTVTLNKQYLSSMPNPQNPPQTKTQAEINYENAKEGTIQNEKSRQIHEELVAILNKLFNNQVKLTDNFGGTMLEYTFPRLVTRDDVVAVQNYYQKLGYKIDESHGGVLYVSKIGRMLHLLFSVRDKMAGKLEVTY